MWRTACRACWQAVPSIPRPTFVRVSPINRSVPAIIVLMTAVLITGQGTVRAQGVREHTRSTPNRSTAVTEAQANELTLTLTEVSVRPIQTWVRTAGVADETGKVVAAVVSSAEGALIRVGQRVRAFPPDSRSSMYQAKVTRVVQQGDRVLVRASLAAQGRARQRFIMEIVTERGELLSVPNEAIIETGGKHVVYVQQQGRYLPREIHAGVQGELYTHVLDGLKPGEQVVTFGSFFIDAEYKLKGT